MAKNCFYRKNADFTVFYTFLPQKNFVQSIGYQIYVKYFEFKIFLDYEILNLWFILKSGKISH